MHKLLIVSLFMLIPTSCRAVDNDKLMHFIGIAGITTVTYVITEDVGTSLLVGLGVGLAKEIYDTNSTGFSKSDLAADALGAAAGIGIGMAFTYKYEF